MTPGGLRKIMLRRLRQKGRIRGAASSPHHNPVRNILSQMLRATFPIQRQVVAAMKSGMRAMLTIVAVEEAKVFEH